LRNNKWECHRSLMDQYSRCRSNLI
jgi:hypothetical protein